MEDLEDKIMGFKGWSDREKKLAVLCSRNGGITLSEGVTAESLQATLEAQLSIGGCLGLTGPQELYLKFCQNEPEHYSFFQFQAVLLAVIFICAQFFSSSISSTGSLQVWVAAAVVLRKRGTLPVLCGI